jgi:hypothetical protein
LAYLAEEFWVINHLPPMTLMDSTLPCKSPSTGIALGHQGEAAMLPAAVSRLDLHAGDFNQELNRTSKAAAFGADFR